MRSHRRRDRALLIFSRNKLRTSNLFKLETSKHLARLNLLSRSLLLVRLTESGAPIMSSAASKNPAVIAAVEGGGSSFKVAVCQVTGDDPVVLAREEVKTSSDNPAATLAECVAFLQKHKPANGYQALGLATFGPVGVRPDDPDTYGRILESSPKAAWRNMDLLTPLATVNNIQQQVLVETDVNAPALAEFERAKQKQPHITSLAYVTVGTGVGVGLVVNGKPVHGRMHPEGGHVPVIPLAGDDFGGYSWGSKSPFFGQNTVEGLASSVALTERLQRL